jgi:hypothetical protein
MEHKWHQLEVEWFKKASSFCRKGTRATTGASKKKIVRQRVSAMGVKESGNSQKK